jgi:hypothetical protein
VRQLHLVHRSAARHSDFPTISTPGCRTQLPLTLALATVGAGIELVVVQSGPGEMPGGEGTRLLLAGGVAVYLVSVTVANTGTAKRTRSRW